jgi:transcriptional regulator GlxA family with amidase domain
MSIEAHAATGAARPKPSLRVGLILADNFTLSAFALFTDHLRLAADEGDLSRPVRVRWSIMAPTPEPIRASCGVRLTPTDGLLPPEDLDYVVVVGGILHAGRQLNIATGDYLRRAAEAGTILVGLCTGSFILCREGLMRDRRTCVSWYHAQDFVDAFPDQAMVADRLFLDDGDRITCAGGAGTADLAIHLIERHLSRAIAQKASQVLLFDRARAGGDAQPHPPLSQTFTDPRIRRATLIMEQALASPMAIAAVAAQIGLSTRQFERLCLAKVGLTPGALYRQLRLRYAAGREHGPLDHGDRSGRGVRGRLALHPAVQGLLRPVAVAAPPAAVRRARRSARFRRRPGLQLTGQGSKAYT